MPTAIAFPAQRASMAHAEANFDYSHELNSDNGRA
jgi:hypothetical protein